jgi:hypothetical protein
MVWLVVGGGGAIAPLLGKVRGALALAGPASETVEKENHGDHRGAARTQRKLGAKEGTEKPYFER